MRTIPNGDYEITAELLRDSITQEDVVADYKTALTTLRSNRTRGKGAECFLWGDKWHYPVKGLVQYAIKSTENRHNRYPHIHKANEASQAARRKRKLAAI